MLCAGSQKTMCQLHRRHKCKAEPMKVAASSERFTQQPVSQGGRKACTSFHQTSTFGNQETKPPSSRHQGTTLELCHLGPRRLGTAFLVRSLDCNLAMVSNNRHKHQSCHSHMSCNLSKPTPLMDSTSRRWCPYPGRRAAFLHQNS